MTWKVLAVTLFCILLAVSILNLTRTYDVSWNGSAEVTVWGNEMAFCNTSLRLSDAEIRCIDGWSYPREQVIRVVLKPLNQ